MDWLFGTGMSHRTYLVVGLILELMVNYFDAGVVPALIVMFGTFGLAELARIRDEIRKFND
jgi:hypothetical protein